MATVSEQIQEIYIGLLGRAADKSGLDYWTAEINAGKLTIEQLRANIVNEQPEYAAGLGSMTRAQTVNELYNRLFERAAETDGLEYWVNGAGSTVNVDQLVLALSAGASAADKLVLDNKTDAAEFYTANIATYSADSAKAAVDSVDGTAASVDASKAATTAGSGVSGSTFTLTTGVDAIVGTADNDAISALSGATASAATDTLTVVDTIDGGAGTDTLTITTTAANTDVTDGALITNIETVNVRATGAGTSSLDASKIAGLTGFNTELSTGNVAVTNLATGSTVGVIGNSTVANGDLSFAYKKATDAIKLSLQNGVTAGAVAATASAGVTAATISSIGAANTIASLELDSADANTVTSLTVNADSKLTVTALTADDYANTAALTVTGAGAVALGNEGTFKTVDATANTGGLTLAIDTVATSVKGGSGNDKFTSAATTATTAGLVDAGAGTDTLVVNTATDIDTAAEGAEYVNFETLSVSTNQDVSLIAGITALEVTDGGNTLTKLNATQAAAVTQTATGATNSYALEDASGTSDALTLNLKSATATTNVDATALTVDGFETLNINATTGTAGTDSDVSFASADKLTAVNVTGSADITVDGANTAKAVTLNASAVTGAVTVSGNFVNGSAVTTGAGKDTATLGTGFGTYSTGAGDDILNGTLAQLNTAANFNVLDGGAGTDTLNITGGAALTVVDNNLSKISNIEKIVIATTTTNDQTITTGGFFDTAFKTDGANLTTTTTTGDVNIDMTSFTGNATLSVTTVGTGVGEGGITIQTGVGADKVTVVNALAGDNSSIKTFAGNDTIVGGADVDTINAGTGADTMTGNGGADVFVFAAGDNGAAPSATVLDIITDYTSGTDVIDFGATAITQGTNTTAAAVEGHAAVTAGVVTFVAADDTLAERIIAVNDALDDIANNDGATDAVAGESLVFAHGDNSYIYISDGVAGIGANDVLIQLTGIAGGAGTDSLTIGGGDITGLA